MIISRFRISLPLLLAALCQQALAANNLPAVESFFRTPQISLVTLSPKGGAVALVMQDANGNQTLAIRDTADPSKVDVITHTGDVGRIVAVHWINEERIGFTIKDLYKEFETNLEEFASDRSGSNFTRLISGGWRQQQELGTHVTSRVLTFDYFYHSATHDGSDDILVEKASWNKVDLLPEQSRLYRLNTRTRDLHSAVEGTQPPLSIDWVLDGSDTPRIAQSVIKGRCLVHYRAPGSDNWSEIGNHSCTANDGWEPLFFDGADTLFVRAPYQGYGALFRYKLSTRTLETEPVLSVPGFDIAGHAEFETDGVTRKVVGIRLQADAATTIWFDPAMKAEQAKIDAALPGAINEVHCADRCDVPVLLVKSRSDRKPVSYLLYTRASGKLVSLGSEHPDIKPAQMGLRDFHHYAARDGRQIPAYVTTPPDKTTTPRPTVVLVHGGPHTRGAYWDWSAQAQFLASRGYLVIEPEFRGSTGYGYAHFQAGWQQWGEAMQDDLADAAQWAVKQGWADPRRICIMGTSYGGYATLMGLIKNPELFRCGVTYAGVTDIALMFNHALVDASREDRNYSMRTLIGDPQQDAARMARNSPLQRTAELKQPLLLGHGALDRRVPIAHATRFRDALQQTNPNLSTAFYPEEGHGWFHDESRIDFWNKVDAFLDKNLKQAP